MRFQYTATDFQGEEKQGLVEAETAEKARKRLENQDLSVSAIEAFHGEAKNSWRKSLEDWWNKLQEGEFNTNITLFERVSNKDIVIFSRQIATLFESEISALRVFQLLSENAENPLLARTLKQVTNDIRGGLSISQAMERHPKVFSKFYVNMVRAGEESGQLNDTFLYLADYLERTYALVSKTRNALVYPAFVIAVFIGVMVLMLTFVIPQLSKIIEGAGQELPIYTKIVVGLSDFLVNYGLLLLLVLIAASVGLWIYGPRFGITWDRTKISIPYMKGLFQKFYLSRIADNINTMLASGVPMVRALEITAEVVGNDVYRDIMLDITEQVRGGSSVSGAMAQYPEAISGIMVQMTKVGEESGELGNILSTLSHFYRREVENAVDTLIGLIEPAMIIALGLSVAVLLASVLMPIYNTASGI